MSACRSCGADVWWLATKAGKRMPVDTLPSDHGNVQVIGSQARVLTAEQLQENTGPLHTSHFATCANAKGHRRG